MTNEFKRIEPGPGQESVWDYPRPPRLEQEPQRLRVLFDGQTIADTVRGLRLLETSHPPVYYFPPGDIVTGHLRAESGQSFCEFKGVARYWSIFTKDHTSRNVAWSYPQPSHAYEALTNHVAFYPSRVSACFVGEEKVIPQDGDFYGGWITSRIIGPFKGAPGTRYW